MIAGVATALTAFGLAASTQFSVAGPSAPQCQGRDATRVGTPGDDEFHLTTEKDQVVVGLGGDDFVYPGDGPGRLWFCGGGGNDGASFSANSGPQLSFVSLMGGPGRDTFYSLQDEGFQFDGREALFGGPGRDWLTSSYSKDTIYGGPGPDRIDGDASADEVRGGGGADTIQGNHGDDLLLGGEDDDRIKGGIGNDVADGGGGTDLCRADIKRRCER